LDIALFMLIPDSEERVCGAEEEGEEGDDQGLVAVLVDAAVDH